MSFFSKLVGGQVVDAATGISNIVDKFVETPDEKRAAEVLKLKMLQRPAELQAELNKIEAGHRTVFVAGWRPFIGWVCGVGLAYHYLLYPILGGLLKLNPIDASTLVELILAMLGLGILRSVEKMNGAAK
jgi:hypothetical protein